MEGYTPEPGLRWNVAAGLRDADQALVDAVNGILRRRMEDGTIKAIFENYGIPYYPPFKQEVTPRPPTSGATSEEVEDK